jgi:hypothetical protein
MLLDPLILPREHNYRRQLQDRDDVPETRQAADFH